MSEGRHTKLVREDEYVAEIAVERIDSPDSWAPYLSLEDAQRLDAVRLALRRGDVSTAARYGRVYRLTPLSAS